MSGFATGGGAEERPRCHAQRRGPDRARVLPPAAVHPWRHPLRELLHCKNCLIRLLAKLLYPQASSVPVSSLAPTSSTLKCGCQSSLLCRVHGTIVLPPAPADYPTTVPRCNDLCVSGCDCASTCAREHTDRSALRDTPGFCSSCVCVLPCGLVSRG